MAKPDGRYRQAAADYTGLPVTSPVVVRLAAHAASMADWAALEFLRHLSGYFEDMHQGRRERW